MAETWQADNASPDEMLNILEINVDRVLSVMIQRLLASPRPPGGCPEDKYPAEWWRDVINNSSAAATLSLRTTECLQC